jgi:hypothetical protein
MARSTLVSGLAPGVYVEVHGRGGQFLDLVLPHLWPAVDRGAARMDRRTKLKPDEKALLQKLQRGTWSLAELAWLEHQLPKDAPTVLVAELRHKRQMLRHPESTGEIP